MRYGTWGVLYWVCEMRCSVRYGAMVLWCYGPRFKRGHSH